MLSEQYTLVWRTILLSNDTLQFLFYVFFKAYKKIIRLRINDYSEYSPIIGLPSAKNAMFLKTVHA